MVSFVLDSSIALSWLMPDEVASLDILDKTITEGAIVPAIWGLEIGNVLYYMQSVQNVLLQINVTKQFIL
ncbi:hypothetical protein [Rickettsia massiliae]|uniref:hypothetical protein n=1 Tax=Rickettsia massiliae TaxID=35791 RepID=UPI0002D41C15|nr:hypothetical protein [Rickettsia massiliae]